MNDFFYIIGAAFILPLIFLVFRSKEKVLREQDDLKYCLNNPFETLNFIRNNAPKIIVSLIFYLWVIIGIIASSQRLMFIIILIYGFIASIPYFMESKNKRYWAETIAYAVGAALIGSTIYFHYYG